jgi:hypothetical protein
MDNFSVVNRFLLTDIASVASVQGGASAPLFLPTFQNQAGKQFVDFRLPITDLEEPG